MQAPSRKSTEGMKSSGENSTSSIPQSLSSQQWLFLQHVAKLITWAADKGMQLTGGELYRPDATQRLYLAQGKSKVRFSRHQQRLAIDLNLFLAGVYQQHTEAYAPLGAYWCSLHPLNRWGGDWNKDGRTDTTGLRDGNHFEMAI
jgi:hypothetical protein